VLSALGVTAEAARRLVTEAPELAERVRNRSLVSRVRMRSL
jgi:hypothetical protein